MTNESSAAIVLQVDCLVGNAIEFHPHGETDRYLTDRTRYHLCETVIEIARSLRADDTHPCEHLFTREHFPEQVYRQPSRWWARFASEAELLTRDLASGRLYCATNTARRVITMTAVWYLAREAEDPFMDEKFDESCPTQLAAQEHDHDFLTALLDIVPVDELDSLKRGVFGPPDDWFFPSAP
ncbi:hypothetical protein [Aeromicrobium sp. 179-A 4D2 NHS]|uniref:hypothetical protein n=1 Tax=Aeromicrobium sp. 179-A 4D2 NHS TaxID=3142375 RepID=UPI0039A27C76